MKKNIKLLALLLLVITNSCTSDDIQIANIEIETSLNEKFPIHFEENKNQENIEYTYLINIDNSDTNEYLDNIKEITITSFTYKIIDLSGGDEFAYLEANIFADNIQLFSNQETHIQQDFNSEKIFKVDQNKLNQVADVLLASKQISLKLSGNYQSQAVTDFKIEFKIDLKIVASPL